MWDEVYTQLAQGGEHGRTTRPRQRDGRRRRRRREGADNTGEDSRQDSGDVGALPAAAAAEEGEGNAEDAVVVAVRGSVVFLDRAQEISVGIRHSRRALVLAVAIGPTLIGVEASCAFDNQTR